MAMSAMLDTNRGGDGGSAAEERLIGSRLLGTTK